MTAADCRNGRTNQPSNSPPTGPISLPVLPATETGKPRNSIARSKNGPRRALVLLLVHVVFVLHLTHWLIAGETVSPVEPSESMRTLELGQVNAGAVFFALAILSTLIFGRFFCGWGCHIVALQDLCGWIMKKCGVRPKPFRSRLLVFIPLALALYMFVWPTFKREALGPLLRGVWPTIDRDLAITAFPEQGFTNHLITEGFWDTFAGPLMAIPFLLICGFASVYFLGAKGFCTYGCPYGGLFGPADLVAPGKIIVDHAKCHQCGHCTAVCTSNVRVHDEIREYGSVVDPGCMKCMDCVSVCPNGALRFGFARPSLWKGKPRVRAPRRVFDTTRREDLALIAVFLLVFLAWRGAYAAVPMLMAVGIAGCGAFFSWKSWRILRERDERFSVFQLKRLGRITRAGIVALTLTAGFAALTAHTGAINMNAALGGKLYDQLSLQKARFLIANQPALAAEQRDQARRALERYTFASGFDSGGYGLFTPTPFALRRALLHLALGEPDAAATLIRDVLKRDGPSDELTADLGRVLVLLKQPDEALELYARTLATRPEFWAVREQWSLMLEARGRGSEALAAAESALAGIQPRAFSREAHARTRLILSRLLRASGRPEEALEQLRLANEVRPRDPVLRENYAAAIFGVKRDVPAAIEQLKIALELSPGNLDRMFQLARLLLQAGRTDEARAIATDLLRRVRDDESWRSRVLALIPDLTPNADDQ